MVCLGFELMVAVWKAHTNPLSYSAAPLVKTLEEILEINDYLS